MSKVNSFPLGALNKAIDSVFSYDLRYIVVFATLSSLIITIFHSEFWGNVARLRLNTWNKLVEQTLTNSKTKSTHFLLIVSAPGDQNITRKVVECLLITVRVKINCYRGLSVWELVKGISSVLSLTIIVLSYFPNIITLFISVYNLIVFYGHTERNFKVNKVYIQVIFPCKRRYMKKNMKKLLHFSLPAKPIFGIFFHIYIPNSRLTRFYV